MENCQSLVDCNVYTYGSKLEGRVVAGMFTVHNGSPIVEDKFRLPDTSMVYQAIREAAMLLAEFDSLSTVKFFVDSQAALRTFQSDFITSKLALQTIHSLNHIPAQSVVLVWTKTHAGYEGNEKADNLAKQGTTLPHAPLASIKSSMKEYFITLWNKE